MECREFRRAEEEGSSGEIKPKEESTTFATC